MGAQPGPPGRLRAVRDPARSALSKTLAARRPLHSARPPAHHPPTHTRVWASSATRLTTAASLWPGRPLGLLQTPRRAAEKLREQWTWSPAWGGEGGGERRREEKEESVSEREGGGDRTGGGRADQVQPLRETEAQPNACPTLSGLWHPSGWLGPGLPSADGLWAGPCGRLQWHPGQLPSTRGHSDTRDPAPDEARGLPALRLPHLLHQCRPRTRPLAPLGPAVIAVLLLAVSL